MNSEDYPIRPSGILRKRCGSVLCGMVLLALGIPAAMAHVPPQQPPPPPGVVPIQMISNRADLISGGNASLEIQIAPDTDLSELVIDVDGRDVTSSFDFRPTGRFEGVVEGLVLGENELRVRIGDTLGGRITITNHPLTGPVFAGPQVEPWICTTEENGLGPPEDAENCHVPTRFHFEYMSATTGQFMPYDPDNPPDDVATTTTDAGETVPYIIRIERGTIGRGIYDIAVLFEPGAEWQPWDPQPGWNGKLLWLFGDETATSHVQAPPPEVRRDVALSRGYMVAGSGLNVHGANANDVVSSEALMMVGEHIFETYGEVRYTIGSGCGGGALLQLTSAATYPRLLNGLVLECTVPDLWTTFTEYGDCGLLVRYQTETSPQLWGLPQQRAAAAGHSSVLTCEAMGRQQRPTFFDPTSGEGCGGFEWTYDPQTNPDGERCLPQDYQQAVFGAREGDGFAPRAFDNVGVQYGLEAVLAGDILPEQFVDMNEQVGCFDIDGQWQPERCTADPQALEFVYSSGRVAGGVELAKLPIMDLRGTLVSEEHYPFRSLVLRARLDRDLGYHDHHVIWSYPGMVEAPDDVFEEALLTIDDWLAAIEGDVSDTPLADKVLAARPADAVDSCFPDLMMRVEDDTICGAMNADSSRGTRIATGAPPTSDVIKCQRRPFDAADYAESPVPFTAAQLDRLADVFQQGVCDYGQAGVEQGPQAGPNQSFSDGPGGVPLGQAPGTQALPAMEPEDSEPPDFGNKGGALSALWLGGIGLWWLRRRRRRHTTRRRWSLASAASSVRHAKPTPKAPPA